MKHRSNNAQRRNDDDIQAHSSRPQQKIVLGCEPDNNGRRAIIIQARMGSHRLPGKVLRRLAGHFLIDWVIDRSRTATQIDQIVVAISDHHRDDPLATHIVRRGIPLFRGSETDVLRRFIDAATHFNIHTIVRVCADNPLVSPEEIDRLIAYYTANALDYAYNHIPINGNRYPNGLGAEVLSRCLLEQIDRIAYKGCHREHVTQYIWDHPEHFKIGGPVFNWTSSRVDPTHIKLDIDTLTDWKRMDQLCGQLTLTSTTKDILERYPNENHPLLFEYL